MPQIKKTYTEEELKFRTGLGERLAGIEGKLDGLREQLTPIIALQTTVTEHDRQIYRWKGVNATLASVVGILVTVLGAIYGKFKHIF